jgi:prefoldin subunit 4
MNLPLPEAQELLSTATTELESEVSTLEDELSGLKEELNGLKAHLYARFGKGINLEA